MQPVGILITHKIYLNYIHFFFLKLGLLPLPT